MTRSVLVTGGAGYIGTHVLVALAASGRKSLCVDNYSNSSPRAIERVEAIAPGTVKAVQMDIADVQGLRALLRDQDIDSVIHLAGLKSVAESVTNPGLYRHNNVVGTQHLLEALSDSKIRTFVFSSSACVYAVSEKQPLDESAPLGPYNPYGENKLEVERMLESTAMHDNSWRVANLRYFNPVGAHVSGTIGEDPSGTPNNLMPYVCQVATGRRKLLSIFGSDYPTIDGTGVRDYIHVMDLAEGHVASLDSLQQMRTGTVLNVNLGTGRGCSVLELVTTFERINGLRIPREFVARRAGDIAEYFADPSLAKRVLGWKARRGVEEMCRDAWNWQRQNPEGYGK
jgi:UDP-glucose 4-epimerase